MIHNNEAIQIEVLSPKKADTENSETSMMSPSTGSKPQKMGSKVDIEFRHYLLNRPR